MADSSKSTQGRSNRRDYERVQDAVSLEIKRLHEIPAAGETQSSLVVKPKVRRANKYDIDGYANVKQEYPAVASYVQELEERIRQLLLDGANPADSPTHKVSLSASGMAFADESLMYPGEQVGITITLYPSLKTVACDARIVSAGDAPEISNGDKHTYRVIFLRITDSDKEVLNQHVTALLKSIPNDGE